MAESKNKRVIIVAGPTAVGKTAVAIELAKHFGTEIISADSRQCYKELNIGVARPSVAELNTVKHHFIASHSVQEEVTAITFEQYALQKTKEIFRLNDVVVMVGGTGLYIKAFCEGLDAIPDIDPLIRKQIIEGYKGNGIDWLQNQLQEKDPAFYKSGEMKNPQRMMRALEVMECTGNSIMDFRKREKSKRDFSLIKLGLELPKEDLVTRIHRRVDKMVEVGLLEEVKGLLPFKDLTALQTVGYTEVFNYMNGKLSLADAIERIKINTRQYAKRQLTWFRKDPAIHWFAPEDIRSILEYVQ
jgi:tRNA dimethylallyltransferase